jgi:hypothetical protein
MYRQRFKWIALAGFALASAGVELASPIVRHLAPTEEGPTHDEYHHHRSRCGDATKPKRDKKALRRKRALVKKSKKRNRR